MHLAHRNRSDFCDLRLRCPSRTPEIARSPRQETAMMHCDLRVRWKDASDLRFRAAISEPKTPSFCGISGDLAPSTRKSLAIAIVRFWCAKQMHYLHSYWVWRVVLIAPSRDAAHIWHLNPLMATMFPQALYIVEMHPKMPGPC